jgi:hypothetical protein
VDDQFNSGGLPAHWVPYNFPLGAYGPGSKNCAIPSHVVVSGGTLHLMMFYETSGLCGAGWYTGVVALAGHSSVDSRITVRFRVVDNGVSGHLIILRWPDVVSSWPASGEEDYCESDDTLGCTTYLHYGADYSHILTNQHTYQVDLTQWHTFRFQRLDHVVTVYIDDMTTPAWTFTGSSTTLPDTLKLAILQQECHAGGCPTGTSGSEDIQIDWITVENPTP